MSQGQRTEIVGLVIVDGVVIEKSPRELARAGFTPNKNLPIVIFSMSAETFNQSWRV